MWIKVDNYLSTFNRACVDQCNPFPIRKRSLILFPFLLVYPKSPTSHIRAGQQSSSFSWEPAHCSRLSWSRPRLDPSPSNLYLVATFSSAHFTVLVLQRRAIHSQTHRVCARFRCSLPAHTRRCPSRLGQLSVPPPQTAFLFRARCYSYAFGYQSAEFIQRFNRYSNRATTFRG